ncbi:DNA-binding transcriptional regulator, CsgD family [Bacteroidales bacterium 6E]|nr:DNA-binding transcriptional regulator, CsgD family [Bacteroidales bacterium 6E]
MLTSLSIFLILLSGFAAGQDARDMQTQASRHFSKLEYRAASQNWDVSTAGNGLTYFANHQGLLEFDGNAWILYPLPNNTISRSVLAVSDSLIYTSGYMELGYWKPDPFGILQYTSLNPLALKYFSKNIEFWNIESSKGWTYFHSFTRTLALRNDSIAPVVLSGFATVMNQVNGKVLVAIMDDGIYELDGTRAVPFIRDDFFRNKMVRFMLPFSNEKIMIGTASHGVFIWDGTNFIPWNQAWTNYFIKNELNRGAVTPDGKIVLGTITDGISVFDQQGNQLLNAHAPEGLPNNTVLGIDTDGQGHIWVALDDGIGFIPTAQEQSARVIELKGIGAVYATAVHKGYTYLGTNQGLFVRRPGDEETDFRAIPGTQGQVWDLRVIDGWLWMGHNDGTFLVDGEKIRQISTQSGAFSVRPDPMNSDLLIQCTYTNLVVYRKQGDAFVREKNMEGFYDLIRYIEPDYLGNIWASHMHRGIFRIRTDDQRNQVTGVSYLGEQVFGKDHSIHVFNVENRIVFTTQKKLYTFDDLKDTIVEYPYLNDRLGEYAASHRIVGAPDHHYWFILNERIGLFYIFQDSVARVGEIPFSLFGKTPKVDEFENLLPLTETKALVCLQDGYALVDALSLNRDSPIRRMKPQLRMVRHSNNRGREQLVPLNAMDIEVPHNQSNLSFRFSFPLYSELPVGFLYYLEGLNSGWSGTTDIPQFNFERLPKGEYLLRVKASDLIGNESEEFQYAFEVLPPWYESVYAAIAYSLFLIAVMFGFRAWGIRQTRLKEKEMHEAREKELIRLRNEKLRNEVEHKSKELANSTMSIIKKNESLMEIRKILANQKTELGSRYPDKFFNYIVGKIDENISNQDDWRIFETNFERAHEQFFTKIKEKYPDLTSGDLRLCAYLRMNLSSKEIAPLLGISVRGVENHRYRLRKKLGLDHDDMLSDIIHTI